MGGVVPLGLPLPPPVQPPAAALLGVEVEATAQQSVEVMEAPGSSSATRLLLLLLPVEGMELVHGVAQVPLADEVVLVAQPGQVLEERGVCQAVRSSLVGLPQEVWGYWGPGRRD